MTRAVIETGGHQYLVAEGQTVSVAALAAKEGEAITFERVLGIVDGEQTVVMPKGAKVEAKIVRHERGDKVVVEKFKSKKRYHRRHTHRQPATVVLIEKIIH